MKVNCNDRRFVATAAKYSTVGNGRTTSSKGFVSKAVKTIEKFESKEKNDDFLTGT